MGLRTWWERVQQYNKNSRVLSGLEASEERQLLADCAEEIRNNLQHLFVSMIPDPELRTRGGMTRTERNFYLMEQNDALAEIVAHADYTRAVGQANNVEDADAVVGKRFGVFDRDWSVRGALGFGVE